MNTPLDLYFEEINSNISEIDSELMKPSPNHGKIKKSIKSMEEAIKQATLEVRMANDPNGELKSKITTLKAKAASKKAEAEKALLVGGGNGGSGSETTESKSIEDRRRLEHVNEKLMKQSETLERCHNIVNETEAVGVDILNELGENREKLAEVKDKSKEIDGMLDDASTRMKRMQRREDMGGCSLS
jgi:chromosome segregation ATPase